MVRKFVLTCGMVLCGVVLSYAADAVVEFEGRYWMPNLTAKAKVTESNISGTDINFKSDLGVKDENFSEGRLIWHIGPNSKIRAYYTQAEFKGDETVSRTVVFDGKTYTAGTQVKSKVDLQYFGLGWLWEFINVFDGKVKMGTILEAKGVGGEATLEAPALAINESTDFLAGLPTVGATVTISPFKSEKPYNGENLLSNLSVYAEAAGMSAGRYGYFIDAEAGVKWIPVKYFSISGGYRTVSLKAQDKPDYAKFSLKGPFAAASIRF